MTFPVNAAVDGRRTLRTITWARLYKVTRKDGVFIRWTDHDGLLEFDEADDGVMVEYTPAEAPSWESTRSEQGTSEGSSSLDGIVTSGGTMDVDDVRMGKWDRSVLDVWVVDWRYPWLGYIMHDVYRIQEIQRSGETWKPELQTVTGEMERQVGRVYNRHCDADYGDSRCTVVVAATNGSVTAVSGWSAAHPRQRFRTDLVAADGVYRHGILTWTSGNNLIAGLTSFDVKYYVQSNGEVELWTETPNDIEIGDDFAIKPGCGKALSKNCDGENSNSLNFRGFPWMPTVRQTLKTPNVH